MVELSADPRTKDLFLIDSILYPLVICGFYFFGIIYLTKFMQNREPVDLKCFTRIYDMLASSLNTGLLIFFTFHMTRSKYSAFCNPVKPLGNGESTIAIGFYVYFLSRVLESVDSVLIILKKKHGSNLTVQCAHHSSMIMVTWIGTRYAPSGSSAIFATINTAFHAIMYLYYYISVWKATDPCTLFGDILPFRTCTTALQDVQFILVILHCLTGLYFNCGYPIPLYIFVLTFSSFLYAVILLSRFLPKRQASQ